MRWVRGGLRVNWFFAVLLLLNLFEKVFQTVVTVFPELSVPAQPLVEFLKGFCPEGANPAVGDGFHFDEACVTQHFQVLGGLRLTDLESRSDFAHGERLLDQQFDDVQAVRFSQRTECGGVQKGSSSPAVVSLA